MALLAKMFQTQCNQRVQTNNEHVHADTYCLYVVEHTCCIEHSLLRGRQPAPANYSIVSILTISLSTPNGPSAWRTFARHLGPASRAHQIA